MAGYDEATDVWHKSGSSADGGCVEVRIADEHVHVRDTKDRQGAHLTFTYREWRAFLTGVRLGEFDLPDAAPS
jgi:hypothetical protein